MAYPAYRPTPARALALKKAQAASAAKRRGKGKGKLAAANRQLIKHSNRRSNIKKAAKYTAYGVAAAGATVAAAHGARQVKRYHGRFQTVTAKHNMNSEVDRLVLKGRLKANLTKSQGRARAATHGLPTGHTMAGRNQHNRHRGVVVEGSGHVMSTVTHTGHRLSHPVRSGRRALSARR